MINTRLLSRTVLTTLVVAPLGLMGILCLNVLLPTLKNPESKFYASGIGYPALQRLAGKSIKVQTVSVESRVLADNLAAPGESVALQQVAVRPLVSGAVEKVYVVEGQLVRRGQPLIQLQQFPFLNAVSTARNNVAISDITLQALQKSVPEQLAVLKANVDRAREKLAIAEIKFKQMSSLVQEGAMQKVQLYDSQSLYITSKNDLISQEQMLARTQSDLAKQVATAHLNLENNRITLQNALSNLSYTVVYASTDGLVSQVNIHSGEVADTRFSTSVMTLTQNIVFKAYIDQARLNAVKIGDQPTVRLIAYPGRTYQGRVVQLNPTVETAAVKPGQVGVTRQYTYSVWIAVDSLQMPPGLQGYVQFNQSKASLVIPESAVTHLSGGEGMVMVNEAGRAVVKKVKLGRIFDNQRELLEGLMLGEQVVVSPRSLNPNDLLKAQLN